MERDQMLPDELAADGAPTGSRYDHVVRLFGDKFVKEKIMNARTFMVCVLNSATPNAGEGRAGVCVLSWVDQYLGSKHFK